MPKNVEIEGVGVVEFPDSMSDADITKAIETEILPQAKVAGERPSTPVKDLVAGFGAGVLKTAGGAQDLLMDMNPATLAANAGKRMARSIRGKGLTETITGEPPPDMMASIPRLSQTEYVKPPDSLPGKVGYAIEGLAEWLYPGAKIAQANAGRSLLTRIGAEAASGAAQGAVKSGGDPAETAMGAVLGAGGYMTVNAVGAVIRGLRNPALRPTLLQIASDAADRSPTATLIRGVWRMLNGAADAMPAAQGAEDAVAAAMRKIEEARLPEGGEPIQQFPTPGPKPKPQWLVEQEARQAARHAARATGTPDPPPAAPAPMPAPVQPAPQAGDRIAAAQRKFRAAVRQAENELGPGATDPEISRRAKNILAGSKTVETHSTPVPGIPVRSEVTQTAADQLRAARKPKAQSEPAPTPKAEPVPARAPEPTPAPPAAIPETPQPKMTREEVEQQFKEMVTGQKGPGVVTLPSTPPTAAQTAAKDAAIDHNRDEKAVEIANWLRANNMKPDDFPPDMQAKAGSPETWAKVREAMRGADVSPTPSYKDRLIQLGDAIRSKRALSASDWDGLTPEDAEKFRRLQKEYSRPVKEWAPSELRTSPAGSGFDAVEGEFTQLDPGDDFYYHVTTEARARQIAREGLRPNAIPSMAEGAYREYSKGKVFLSERGGVSYWQNRIADHIEHETGREPKLKVLRIHKSAVPRLQSDDLGTRDSGVPSYFSEAAIAKPTARDKVAAAKKRGKKAPEKSPVDDMTPEQAERWLLDEAERRRAGAIRPQQQSKFVKASAPANPPSHMDTVDVRRYAQSERDAMGGRIGNATARGLSRAQLEDRYRIGVEAGEVPNGFLDEYIQAWKGK